MRKYFEIFAAACLVACSASAAPTEDGLYAHFVTSHGDFYCRLEFEKTPRTVANFVSLAEGTRNWVDVASGGIVERRYYDGQTVHRVDKGFVIQGGSPTGLSNGTPGYRFNDEFHPDLKHNKAGILSMANAGSNTNGGQFFITLAATPNVQALDGRHSVFGEVVEGMDIVFDIEDVEVDESDRPVEAVVLQAVNILRLGESANAFDPDSIEPPLPEVRPIPVEVRSNSGIHFLHWDAQPDSRNVIFWSEDFEKWSPLFWDPFSQNNGTIVFRTVNDFMAAFPHVFYTVIEYDRE